MNFSNQNPLQTMMNLGRKTNLNPMQQMMNMAVQPQQFQQVPPQTQTPIDRQKLQQAISQFDENAFSQLVQQARMKGISDEEIQKGLDFLLKMR